MWLRTIVVLALAVTASCGDSRSCKIEDVLAELENPQADDCGVLAADDTANDFAAAHDCVAAAIAAQRPFTVQWDLQGIDSRVARALVGTPAGTGVQYRLLAFDGDPSGGSSSGDPHTTTYLCANLVDQGDCANVQTSLCFDCANSSVADECP